MIEEDNKPLSSTGKEELFTKLRGQYRKDRDHANDWRDEAEEDFAFVAGDQYSKEDKEHLQDQLRPIITFNRIDPIMRSVSGSEVTARQEVKYMPREAGDAKANDLLTQAAQWFRDQSDAEDEESDAFLDAAICGMGWTETRLDYDDNEDGAPLIDRVDSLQMCYDHNASKKNIQDARRVHRAKQVTYSEAKEMFPKAEMSDFGGEWANIKVGSEGTTDPERYYSEESDRRIKDEDMVTIIESQWWERETRYIAADPMTGQRMESPSGDNTLTAEEHTKIKERVEMLSAAMGQPIPFKSRKIRKKVYKRAFYSDGMLSNGAEKGPCDGHFSYQAITCFRDRNKGTFYGLVRAMKDPQRWANKWMSQMLHIMNTSAKGGVLMEEGAVKDQREFEDSYSRTDAVTYVNTGAIAGGKIQPKPQSQFPTGFYQMMEFAVSSVRDVTGVNLEMLGMREANQAASLEYQRRQSAMNILAGLFDGLRRYRKNQGRVMLEYITKHLSDGRLVKIVGEKGAQYVPLVKQANTEFDVIVDEATQTVNQKEQVWEFIKPMFMSVPPQIQMILLDYSPLPATVVEELKQAMSQMMESPEAAQAQQMKQKMVTDEHQAKMMKMQSETVENATNARHNAAQEAKLQQEINLQQIMATIPGLGGVQ